MRVQSESVDYTRLPSLQRLQQSDVSKLGSDPSPRGIITLVFLHSAPEMRVKSCYKL